MKYLKELSSYNTFTLGDARKIIGNLPATKKYLGEMVKLGFLKKIRKNLYTCYDFILNEDSANRFQIGSNINQNSYISYHSAFEFYGFYNQMFTEIQVSTNRRFASFEYNKYYYKCFLNDVDIQIDIIQGVKVTSLERTIVDSINMLGKVMDIEELINCLDLIHFINEKKLLEVLEKYNKEILYRKVGYVLSFYKDEFKLSESFFNICLSKGIITNRGALINNDKNNLVFDSEWGLYVYLNLKNINSKGGSLDV